MADAVAAFALTLEDALSPGAMKAKASIASLTSELGTAKTRLSEYQSQLALSKELGDVEGFRKYSALVQESQQKVFGLSQTLEGVPSRLEKTGASAGTVLIAFEAIKITATLAKDAILGFIDVTESLVLKSLEVVNTNQQLEASFEALGQQGEGSGKKTLAMLNELSASLPQSREQLAQWTREIEKTGVTDLSKIRHELVATASAAAIMQDPAAATAYLKLQEKVSHAIEKGTGLKMADTKALRALLAAGVNEADIAKRMGLTVAEFSAKLKAGTIDAHKFGDALSASVSERGRNPLAAMMNSLDVIKKKGGEALSHLFDGVDTKPLTDALRNLIALGDTPAGEGLKMGLTGAMNAVIRMIGNGITEAEIFFLEIEVGALEAYVALKPVIKAVGQISDLMGKIGGGVKGGIDSGAAQLGVAPGVAEEQGGRAGALVVAGFGGPIPQMIELFHQALVTIGDSKAQEIARQGGVQVGQATIEGIRQGVQAHSPSVEAMRIGMDVGAGLGMGMEQSSAPDRAARTISGNALGGLKGGAAGVFGAPANDGGNSVGAIHVTINAPEGVTDAHELSVVGLATALERFQIGSGR